MVTTLHILKNNQIVFDLVFLVFFNFIIFVRTHPTHVYLESSGLSTKMETHPKSVQPYVPMPMCTNYMHVCQGPLSPTHAMYAT